MICLERIRLRKEYRKENSKNESVYKGLIIYVLKEVKLACRPW